MQCAPRCFTGCASNPARGRATPDDATLRGTKASPTHPPTHPLVRAAYVALARRQILAQGALATGPAVRRTRTTGSHSTLSVA
jgi:hypothetical protein